jgi:hypothetical protein
MPGPSRRRTGTPLLSLLEEIFWAAYALFARIVYLVSGVVLPRAILYTLPRGARVSLVIYDTTTGEVVRELLHQAWREAGPSCELWHGRRDAGPDAPAGRYAWKLLAIPGDGLGATWLTSLGATLPVRRPGVDGAAPPRFWETGLGNHVGPRSAAVDPADGAVYLGAGNSENVRNAMRMVREGAEWRCTWSAGPPVRAGHAVAGAASVPVGKFLGRWSMAVLQVGGERRIYHLQQDGYVGFHALDDATLATLNADEQYVFSRDGSQAGAGGGWDALWPYGEWPFSPNARPSPDQWRGYGEVPRDDTQVPLVPMDLAAGKVDIGAQVPVAAVVVSHFEHDLVTVRHPDTGKVLAYAHVERPRGVAVEREADGAGVLAATGGRVVRLTLRTEPDIRALAPRPDPLDPGFPPKPDRLPRHEDVAPAGGESFDAPYRLAVDPATGALWVAEAGESNRVWHLPRDGAPRSFGTAEPRPYGAYEPVRRRFRDITDIEADPATGGFWVVEGSAPRRVALFDAEGEVVREWYGGAFWVPAASPHPGDPGDVWMTATPFELVRLAVDYGAGPGGEPYRVRAVHRFAGIAEGVAAGLGSGGAERAWQVRSHAGRTFLVRRDRINVLEAPPGDAPLAPVAVTQPFKTAKAGDADVDVPVWAWSAAAGREDFARDPYGLYDYNAQSLQAPGGPAGDGLDYFRLAVNDADPFSPMVPLEPARPGDDPPPPRRPGGIYRLRPEWRARDGGPPVPYYRPDRWEWLCGALPGYDHERHYRLPRGAFARGTSHEAVYVAGNREKHPSPDNPETAVEASCLFKLVPAEPGPVGLHTLNPVVRAAWRVGLHQERAYKDGTIAPRPPRVPAPGRIYSLWNNVGVVRRGTGDEVVIATDYDGGQGGEPPPLGYAWNRDGLFAGNPFRVVPPVPGEPWKSIHSSDNRSGELFDYGGDQHGPRGVLYFAGAENEVRVYRLTGWDDEDAPWHHASGSVTLR